MFANGDCYEGDFRQNRLEGHGKYILSDGTVYEGEFKSNCMHGYGICVFADGSRYEGEYSENRITGIGVFYYHTGDRQSRARTLLRCCVELGRDPDELSVCIAADASALPCLVRRLRGSAGERSGARQGDVVLR